MDDSFFFFSTLIIFIISIALCCVFGHFTQKIATEKGYMSSGYFWLGFFLNLVGIIIVACLRDQSTAYSPSYNASNSDASNSAPLFRNISVQPSASDTVPGWTCAFCHTVNSGRLTYCISCRRDRTEIRKIPCPSCGKMNNEDNDVCWVCNQPLHGLPHTTPIAQAAEPPRQASDTANVQPESADPIALLEKLARLHQQGILTDEEFSQKKQDILSRM